MASEDKHKEKLYVSYTVYNFKKTNLKKFTIEKKTKEGNIVKYGVTARGNRFYQKHFYNVKNKKSLEKIFNEAQKKSNLNQNNVTLKTFNYFGKLNKRTNLVSTGLKQNTQYYKVTKRKGKTGEFFTYNVNEVIDEIETFRDEYNINGLR